MNTHTADALELDRMFWPNLEHLPARCEMRGCDALADPRAVRLTSYACTDHMPADVAIEVAR